MARVALLACIGGLAFVVCAFNGFLLWLLPAYVFLTIASLCNTHDTNPYNEPQRHLSYSAGTAVAISILKNYCLG